jgi:hypothetical protein
MGEFYFVSMRFAFKLLLHYVGRISGKETEGGKSGKICDSFFLLSPDSLGST